MKTYLILPLLLLLIGCDSQSKDSRVGHKIDYPFARKEPFDTTIFNIDISDDYFWMRGKENEKEMLDFSRQQGQMALKVLDSLPGTDELESEMSDLFSSMQDEVWNMVPASGYLYYYRDIPDEGTTLCRRKNPDAPEELIMGDIRIKGQSYSVRKHLFAHRKPLVALMLVQDGENHPQIRIFDLEKKVFLSDSIAPVMFNDSRGVSMAWSPDDESILYTQSPPTSILSEKYFNGKVKQHVIGHDESTDEPIFGRDVNETISLSPAETPYINSFSNSPYLIARVRSAEGDNYAYAVHYSKVNGSRTPWILLKNYINLSDGFDASGKWLYAVTTGVPRYHIVKIDMSTGEDPIEFLPQQDDVITGTDSEYNKAIIAAKDVLYTVVRKIGDMHILKVDLQTKQVTKLPLAERASIHSLHLINDNDLMFRTTSGVKMDQYFWYEHKTNTIHDFPFANSVLDKSSELKTEVVYVPSRDGKKIPVSIIYSKTIDIKGNNPWLIEAYGNNGATRDLYFDPYMYPWIKRGGVYAYAHVRGGGELGEDWEKDGQYPHKMNSVNDIVDIAEWLVDCTYSSPSGILVMGASAGSLLVGNAINQRPDLFAGGIYLVGVPDLITGKDAAGARDGNKSIGRGDTPDGFMSNYMQSAYYHVPKGKNLPAMLIVHGATDYILSMHPAARYTAKLQEEQKGERPVLFLVNWEGGHATINPDEPIFILKCALWQTGHPDFQVSSIKMK